MIILIVVVLVEQRLGAYSDDGACLAVCNIEISYFVKLGETDLVSGLDRIFLVCGFSALYNITCNILGSLYFYA